MVYMESIVWCDLYYSMKMKNEKFTSLPKVSRGLIWKKKYNNAITLVCVVCSHVSFEQNTAAVVIFPTFHSQTNSPESIYS